jgi:RimJ/RimL family protein N-acetyltransferase
MNLSQITIRKATKEDAQKVIEYTNLVATESDNLTFGKNEFEITVKEEEIILDNYFNSYNSIFLLAFFEDKIVGSISFSAGKRKRNLHVGEFGMSVKKEFWNKKIGSLLLESLISWAKDTKIIRKINLRVRTDNIPAQKLYEKFKFKKVGTFQRDLFINNTFYDVFLMELLID